MGVRLGSILTGAGGFSTGYQYGEWRNITSEIRQGGNYTLSALTQSAQLFTLFSCVQKIFSRPLLQISSPFLRLPLKCLSQVSGIAILPLVMPSLALIKTGAYPKFYEALRSIATDQHSSLHRPASWLVSALPRELSAETSRRVCFFVDHFERFADFAMMLNGVGLMVQQERLYSAMVVAGIVFNRLFRTRYIPLPLRLFVERYIPVALNVSNLMSDAWLVKLQGALCLANHFRCLRVKADEFFLRFVHRGLQKNLFRAIAFIIRQTRPPNDQFSDGKFVEMFDRESKKLFLLADVEAPLKQRKDLTFEEIKAVLLAEEVELNPVHFSKSVGGKQKAALPEDKDFGKIETYFDEVKWEFRLAVIKKKCKDDDRFIIDLAKCVAKDQTLQSAQVDQAEYRKNFDKYLQQVAGDKESEFLLNWVKEQMQGFMQVLRGEKKFLGSAFEQQQFISNMKKIIPFLIPGQLASVEREDLLLKLAIEGGKYCGTGLVDCSEEILNGLMRNDSSSTGPFSEFERGFYQGFEEARQHIAFPGVLAMMGRDPTVITRKDNSNSSNLPDLLFQTADRHVFRFWKLPMFMGFAPLTPEEMHQFSVVQLAVFWLLRAIMVFHVDFVKEYQDKYYELLDGNTKMTDVNLYIQDVIKLNPKLDAWQKDFLSALISGDFDATHFQSQHNLSQETIASLSEFNKKYQGFSEDELALKEKTPQARQLQDLFGVILGILKCPEVPTT